MAGEYYKYGLSEKHDIPIGHLDYGYIENCSDVKELEKILHVLRSGDEGRYPGLEKVCEDKIEALNPASRLLRKDQPVSMPSSVNKDEWKIINDDMLNWTDNIMKNLKESETDTTMKPSDGGDAKLPPIRKQSQNDHQWESDSADAVVNGEGKERRSDKRVTPRDYEEWDKFDIEAEMAKLDTTQKLDKKSPSKSPSRPRPDLDPSVDSSGLSDEEKKQKADREKEKGNEAFKCGDYEESALYYSRSVSLSPSAAAFNNRALCNLKLERWTDAVNDSNIVIALEPENIKAYMRRGSGYKGLNLIDRARSDFERVLCLEPGNKRAQDLLNAIEKETGDKTESETVEEVREKGRRMLIEEVDGSDDENGINDDLGDTDCHGDKIKRTDEGSSDEIRSSERVLGHSHNTNDETSVDGNILSENQKDCENDVTVNEKIDEKCESVPDRNVDDISGNFSNVELESADKGDDIDVMSLLGIGGSEANTENEDSGDVPSERRDSDVKASCDNFVNDLLEIGMQKEKQSKFDANLNNQNQNHSGQSHGERETESENSASVDKDQDETCVKVVDCDVSHVSETVLSTEGPSSESIEIDEEIGDDVSSNRIGKENKETKYPDCICGMHEVRISNPERRPLFFQIALPPDIAALHEGGNERFRKGQFPEATECYEMAIKLLDDKVSDYERKAPVDQQLKTVPRPSLDKLHPHLARVKIDRSLNSLMINFQKTKVKTEHPVNLSRIHSNCAACLLKTGNCAAAVKHCNKSLSYIPHAIKPLIRRAMAYETLESTRLAYQDFRHVLEIDSSVEAAHHGADRCSKILQRMDGSRWRERIIVPRISLSDIPLIIDLSQCGEEEEREERKLKMLSEASQKSSIIPDTIISDSDSTVKQENATKGPLLPDSAATATMNATGAPVLPDSIYSNNVPVDVTKEKTDLKNVTKKLKDTTKNDYESLKLQGNEFVRKGNFHGAVKSYSQCIKQDPDKCVAYTNRALCYLRLNKPSLAADDCSVVLKLENDNVKALYRRAQARKMLKQYKDSLSDLTHLLKCDTANVEAKKELDLVKQYYREELDALKLKSTESKRTVSAPKTKANPESATTTTTTTNPKRTKHKKKRLIIEEVDGEDDITSSTKNTRTSDDVHQTSRHQQKHEKLKEKASGKHKASQSTSDQLPASPTTPVPPISIPNLENASPFEFIQAWNSLKKHTSTEGYASILKQVPPTSLPMLLSNKLDADMLSVIIRALADHILAQGDNKLAAEILQNLCKASRFQTVAMFLSKKQKHEVKTVIDQLSSNLGSADVAKLKTSFNIKS